MMIRAVGLALALSGCVSQNMPAIVEAMAKDGASVCIHFGATMFTPEWTFARVNAPGVAATCMTGAISTMPQAGLGVATITFPGTLTVTPTR